MVKWNSRLFFHLLALFFVTFACVGVNIITFSYFGWWKSVFSVHMSLWIGKRKAGYFHWSQQIFASTILFLYICRLLCYCWMLLIAMYSKEKSFLVIILSVFFLLPQSLSSFIFSFLFSFNFISEYRAFCVSRKIHIFRMYAMRKIQA